MTETLSEECAKAKAAAQHPSPPHTLAPELAAEPQVAERDVVARNVHALVLCAVDESDTPACRDALHADGPKALAGLSAVRSVKKQKGNRSSHFIIISLTPNI